MSSISVRNLSKHFGHTLAVDGVSLDIRAGELFFLLGPSGCGKTTLLRTIAGLIEPTSGRILFGDRDVTDVPTSRRNTAMVFQNYALWPHMTVRDNVAFGLDVRKLNAREKAERVASVLALVRMEDYTERKPAQLSGGQQQRIALARALAVEPEVLLLDEPLSNLDAKLRQELRSEIRRICKEASTTAVYVTHDQEEALSMADRIAMMHGGRVCQIGSPPELYDRPASRAVADFLGRTNFIPATCAARHNGTLLLDTPLGRLRSNVFPEDVVPGRQVICSLRLEALRLLSGPDRADNEVQGRLLSTDYQGYMAQHTYDVADAVRLKLNELKPPSRPAGQPARLGFDASDLVVLAE